MLLTYNTRENTTVNVYTVLIFLFSVETLGGALVLYHIRRKQVEVLHKKNYMEKQGTETQHKKKIKEA